MQPLWGVLSVKCFFIGFTVLSIKLWCSRAQGLSAWCTTLAEFPRMHRIFIASQKKEMKNATVVSISALLIWIDICVNIVINKKKCTSVILIYGNWVHWWIGLQCSMPMIICSMLCAILLQSVYIRHGNYLDKSKSCSQYQSRLVQVSQAALNENNSKSIIII